jgi:hypothetical protein
VPLAILGFDKCMCVYKKSMIKKNWFKIAFTKLR